MDKALTKDELQKQLSESIASLKVEERHFNNCPKGKVAHYYCDKCDAEVDPEDLYEVDGVDLCVDCLKDMFRKEYH